ncbi:hypothetical protein [Humibacter ginsenosidimutans]|uniref:Uncharacterized protein n=1 Tax=Humibacter ginsenosidimutans TaxID=2599293 RepID=A0A5B8M6D9_9MICO|nr:hypothetical protein [Humibacter ginsenosidimutans]QDZ15933.1 hypothetical protein FPZ11_15170 [Humibacter ginsenosidimutans]
MDLTAVLLRLPVPRIFVVSAPGSSALRLAIERETRARGWVEALTPANTDILVVCGGDGSFLADSTEQIWRQVPCPRAYVQVTTARTLAQQLDDAQAALRDVAALREDAERHEHFHDRETGGHEMDMGGTDHGDMGDMDRGGMGDMDHGDMSMSMDVPGGIPMADRGSDRDGLKLDRLHVALGPALPDWPTGLIVRLVLQGDVVQEAETEAIGLPVGSSFWLEAERDALDPIRVHAAAAADSLQRFLSVAGWRSAAMTGRLLRDELLASAPSTAHPRFVRWMRTVRRSHTLRWSISGLGELGPDAPVGLRGDAYSRSMRWLDEIAAAIKARDADGPADATWGSQRAEGARAVVRMLPSLLIGQEFAGGRLIVASFDPDLETLHELDASARMPADGSGS